MSRKRLFSTILFAVFVFGAVYFLWPSSDKRETFKVLVAKETIPPGESVDLKRFAWAEVDQLLPWMVQDEKQLNGKRTLRMIQAGRYVDDDDFSNVSPILFNSGEGEYTVKAKTEYLNGGRVAAEDIVKVIYVPRQQNGATQVDGKTITDDVMVLSVRNQRGKDITESKKDDLSNAPAGVTLKVESATAERLAASQEYGTLSLFLVKKGVKSSK